MTGEAEEEHVPCNEVTARLVFIVEVSEDDGPQGE